MIQGYRWSIDITTLDNMRFGLFEKYMRFAIKENKLLI